MHPISVICPSCFERFEIACGGESELPADIDYDCEICCRPMRIQCWWDDAEEHAVGEAVALED